MASKKNPGNGKTVDKNRSRREASGRDPVQVMIPKRESREARRLRAAAINQRLADLYPDAKCSLDFANPLQLLIATILSAQCTDARVNLVTPKLFKRFPDADAFAQASLSEIEDLIRSTGFFRNKAKSIKGACSRIVSEFAGVVPNTMEELLTLPGVARKTANVVLGNAHNTPGITVDTHVGRLSRRMGLTKQNQPVKVEADLNAILDPAEWTMFSHRMIFHGRAVCQSRSPKCDTCAVAYLCPKIGVKKAKPPDDAGNVRQ